MRLVAVEDKPTFLFPTRMERVRWTRLYNHRRRGWRTSRIFLVAFWIIMLVASFALIAVFLGTFYIASPVPQLTSLDWAGYVVVSDYLDPKPLVVGINGSWIVPSVTVSQTDTFSAVWIGIGGQSDETLIQTGTEHDSVSGTAIYSAWYELLPNYSVTITTMNVSPSDKITASINLVDPATNKWSIEIVDVTKGQRFKDNFFYNSSRLSAEWIVERPTVDSSISTLANFGSVTFTDSSTKMNTSVGTINSFPFSQVILQDRQNRQLATVSSLTTDGSSFTVNYLTSVFAVVGRMSELLENEVNVAPRSLCHLRSIKI